MGEPASAPWISCHPQEEAISEEPGREGGGGWSGCPLPAYLLAAGSQIPREMCTSQASTLASQVSDGRIPAGADRKALNRALLIKDFITSPKGTVWVSSCSCSFLEKAILFNFSSLFPFSFFSFYFRQGLTRPVLN